MTQLLEGTPTWTPVVGRFRIHTVESGLHGQPWESSGEKCSIGSAEANDLCLTAPTVSGFHCEIRADESGMRIVDLGSLNGTIVDGVSVKEAFLRNGSLIRLGAATLKFELVEGANRLFVSPHASFGGLRGVSVPMRMAFALMEKAAASAITSAMAVLRATMRPRPREPTLSCSSRCSMRRRRWLVVRIIARRRISASSGFRR